MSDIKFTLDEETFACAEETLGNNGHTLWYPSINNNELWNIDCIKGFRTSEKCEQYMQKQVRTRLRELTKAEFKPW